MRFLLIRFSLCNQELVLQQQRYTSWLGLMTPPHWHHFNLDRRDVPELQSTASLEHGVLAHTGFFTCHFFSFIISRRWAKRLPVFPQSDSPDWKINMSPPSVLQMLVFWNSWNCVIDKMPVDMTKHRAANQEFGGNLADLKWIELAQDLI